MNATANKAITITTNPTHTAIKTAVVNKRAKKAEEALKTLKGGVSNV